jgi:hypothetical protein
MKRGGNLSNLSNEGFDVDGSLPPPLYSSAYDINDDMR